MEEIHWLWPYRIPRKLTLFTGKMDVGKSTVIADIVARLTTGADWPDEKKTTLPPSSVIMFCGEDDLGDTVVPRLAAAGADLQRVYLYRSTQINGIERGFSLTTDLALLEDILRDDPSIRLIVFDPLASCFGKKEMNNEQDVREVLGPAKELAKAYDITILGLSHFNKSVGVDASQKTLGSTALSAIQRAVWGFLPDNQDRQHRLMLNVKGNLSPVRTGMKYTIEPAVMNLNGRRIEVGRVKWLGVSTANIDELLNATETSGKSKQAQCRAFLERKLADGTWQDAAKLLEECSAAIGCDERTVQRGCEDLSVKKQKIGEKWQWRLTTKWQPAKHGQDIASESATRQELTQ
jgi:putative DNA primase/helicase